MSGIVECWQDGAHACEAHYNQTANFLLMKYPIVHNCVSDHPSFHCSTYLELLSSHIFESQYLLREFAEKHYEASGIDEEEAKELARSCVSQRDIQVY